MAPEVKKEPHRYAGGKNRLNPLSFLSDIPAKRFVRLSVLLLMAAGTLVYANTFRSPFVFDDINFITRNAPQIHMTTLSWEAVRRAALEGIPAHRYLPRLSFAVNYYLGRENPFGYHLVNLGIHLFTGIFLFFLFRNTLMLDGGPAGSIGENPRVRKKPADGVGWIAFFGALLWLVHPLQTNAVTYLCQRMTSMAALFFVLSLLLYVTGRVRRRNGRRGPSSAFFAGSLISGLCAVASKENAGTLPIFILLYEWFFFQNLKKLRSARPLVWVALSAIVFTVITIHFMGFDPVARVLASYGRRDFTLPQRVMTEWRVVAYYLSLLVFPHPRRLVLDHDYPLSVSLTTPVSTLTSLLAIIGLAVFALYAARKDRLAAFAVIWLLGNLVIESSVIGIEIIYEHRVYLPGMMLFLWFSRQVFRAAGGRKGAATAVLTALALVLGVWAHQRNAVWQTEDAFWQDNIQKSPGKARPYQNLAYSLQARGEYRRAVEYYRKSLAISPHPTALVNMGLCFEHLGYYSDAAEAYSLALKMKPGTATLHADLAVALVHIGEFVAAQAHFEQAARLDPKNPGPGLSLAALRNFLAECREPLACLAAALAQKPDNAELRFKLGMTRESLGDTEAAMADYDAVRRLIGETDRKLYERVVIRQAFLSAMNGDMDATRRLLEKAMATAPGNPNFDYEMAALYASLSQLDKASAWLERAVDKGFRGWDRLRSDHRMESFRNTAYYRNLKRSD